MADEEKRAIVEEKLNFYNEWLHDYDEQETEDYECIPYIKEQIGYYKKELLKMDERDYLSSVYTIIASSLDDLFGINEDVTPSPNKE